MSITLNETSPLFVAANLLESQKNEIARLNQEKVNLFIELDSLKKQAQESVWEINADKMCSAALWSLRLHYPPYKFGTTYAVNKSVDCSAFMKELHAFVNILIPRVSKDQIAKGKPVLYADRRKGDIFGFNIDNDPLDVDHVGLYIGNDQMIHANTPANGVNLVSVAVGSEWHKRLLGIGRYT